MRFIGHTVLANVAFGHLVRDSSCYQARALCVIMHGLPKDRRHSRGTPRLTWLHTVEPDLQPVNIGLFSAQEHTVWRLWRQLCFSVGLAHDDNDEDDEAHTSRMLLHLCHPCTDLSTEKLKISFLSINIMCNTENISRYALSRKHLSV